MAIPLLRGRAIEPSDGPSAARVVVVNEFLARRFWPDADPIGKRLSLDPDDPASSWVTVVGVVHDTARSSLAEPDEEEVYLPFSQTRLYLERDSPAFAYATLVIRTAGDPLALAPAVRAAIASIAPDVAIAEVQSMDQVVAAATARPRFNLLLLLCFAGLALGLAAIGIYGVMSYAVSQRTQEIGIRMTLGASRASVLRLLLGEGVVLAAAGAAGGLGLAALLAGGMSSMLYGVEPLDPPTLFAAAALLLAVAAIATALPAWRATRTHPMAAIRGG